MHDTLGRAGDQPIRPPGGKAPGIHRMQPIDIVGGVDSIKRNRRAQAEAERSESSPRYTSPFKPSGQRPTELNLKRIARDPWPEPDHGPGTEPWDN